MRTRHLIATVAVALCLSCTFARAEDTVQVSEAAVRTLSPKTILYKEVEITLKDIGPAAMPILEAMEKLVKEKKVVANGPWIFVYHGVTEDPNAKFKLQVGIAVADGTTDQGEFKARKLEPFKAVTVLYGGPIASLAQPYGKVFGLIAQNGQTPSGENREYYYHWEGPESHNNIEMIAVGIK